MPRRREPPALSRFGYEIDAFDRIERPFPGQRLKVAYSSPLVGRTGWRHGPRTDANGKSARSRKGALRIEWGTRSV